MMNISKTLLFLFLGKYIFSKHICAKLILDILIFLREILDL